MIDDVRSGEYKLRKSLLSIPLLTLWSIAHTSAQAAVSFLEALMIPGVVEFALCLFASK